MTTQATERETALEEVRAAAEEVLDTLCAIWMPPWAFEGKLDRPITRLVRALRNADEQFFKDRQALLRAVQIKELAEKIRRL